MAQLTRDDAQDVMGKDLVDRDSDKVGSIDDIYLDNETGRPEWALVTGGMFGGKAVFVPLADATSTGSGLKVPYEKSLIKDAPKVEADGELSENEESKLYSHYGLHYSEAASDSGLATGGAPTTGTTDVARDTSGTNTDDAITRSEEELRVGTVRRPSQTVRLKKSIVDETVSKTVPVEKESVHVEREAITDANRGDAMSGDDLTTEEVEMTLSEEEVVVDKQVVPKERIKLDKDVEVEQREVSETVRKEQVEVEGDTGTTR